MPACSAYSLPEARAPRVPRAACRVGSSKSLCCAGAEQTQMRRDSGTASLWFIILSLIIALRFAGALRAPVREVAVMAVLKEKVDGSAAWTAIDGEEESPAHQLHLAQPFRLRARAAADADVGPNIGVDRNRKAAEIERPTVNADARAEEAVRQTREIGEHMQRNLGSV